MRHDFTSGDPNAALNFAAHWHKVSPQGFGAMAAQLPDYLAKSGDTEGYKAVAVPVLQRYMNARIADFQQEPEGDNKTALYYQIQRLHFDLTGKYLDADKLPQTAAPANPLAEREAYVNRQLAELRQRQQAEESAKAQAFTAEVDATSDSGIVGMVEKAMQDANLDKALPGKVFQATRNDWVNAIKSLMDKDATGKERYEMARERAQRSRTPQDKESLLAMNRRRAQVAFAATRREYITSTTRTAVKANEQKRTALQQTAAAGKTPVAGGAPVPQNVARPQDFLPRLPGEADDDWIERNLDRDFGLA
jgi:hypothetical protein